MSPSAKKKKSVILLLGVTASGKTNAAIRIADALNAEIVSVDSMQVYRRMDIGTAKPSQAELRSVRHHLVDVAEPSESFSAARFLEMADAAIADIAARGRRPLIVSGTPLYLMGLMYGLFDGPSADAAYREELRRRAGSEGLSSLHAELMRVDPAAADRIHLNDYKRIERALEVYHLTGEPLSAQQKQWSADQMRYPATVMGIRRSKEDASGRINVRVKEMIRRGLVEEVKSLLAEPAGLSEQARQALGYAQIIDHLDGKISLEAAIERIKIQTRRLAKHQRTWFRKFRNAEWIDVCSDESETSISHRLLEEIER